MDKYRTKKLNHIINDLQIFLEKNYSSKFRSLTEKEDRQLFYLASILSRLKSLSNEVFTPASFNSSIDNSSKIIPFPSH